MTGEWVAPVLAGLAQAQAAAPDTVVAVQPRPEWVAWVDVLSALAQIVIALALLVIGAGVLVAAAQVKRATKQLKEVADKLRVDTQPIVGHATGIADNLHYVSTAVRADVTDLRQLVSGTTRRLNDAAAAVEGRLREFDALLGVVQDEAEDLFVSAASTVRGVRAGADALRARLEARREARDELDEEADEWFDEAGEDGAFGPPDPFSDEAYAFLDAEDEDLDGDDLNDDDDDDGPGDEDVRPLRRRPR